MIINVVAIRVLLPEFCVGYKKTKLKKGLHTYKN